MSTTPQTAEPGPPSTSTAVTDRPAQAPASSRRWWILGVIALAQLIVILDSSIVNIALPTAQRSLAFSNDDRQWIVTGYSLAFGSLLLIGGRLSDSIGRRPMFLVGLVGFAAASAVGGAAQGFEMLVAARVAQGVFGAVLAPAALSLLTTTFTDAKERARAFAVYGIMSGGGGVIGLLLGGVLTEYLSWRWCLYVNVPLAVIAVTGGVLLLGKQPRVENARKNDVPGSLSVVAGLVALVYGLANAETDGWGSVTTVVCVGVGVALLALFVLIESRVTAPLVPLHIIWDRTRGGSFLVIGTIGVGLFAVFLFLTYYVSTVLGYSPIRTGLSFVPMILGIMVAANVVSGLVARYGPRYFVIAGMLLASAGMLVFTQLEVDSSYWTAILPGLLVTGVGVGLAMSPSFNSATAGVDAEHAGVASALVNTLQQIGGSVGTAVLSAFAASALSGYLEGRQPTPANQILAALHSYTTVFWWAAGVFAVGAVVCGLLIRSGPIDVDPDAGPVATH